MTNVSVERMLDPAQLDRQMRAHTHVEDHIERLKDSGLERLPFTNWEANQAWLQTVMWAADLVAWFQLLYLTPGHSPEHARDAHGVTRAAVTVAVYVAVAVTFAALVFRRRDID